MPKDIIDSLSLKVRASPSAVGLGGEEIQMGTAYQYNRPSIPCRDICKARPIVRGVGSCCRSCQYVRLVQKR